MSPIDPTTSLAEIVTERPYLAPVLDRLGLDYCCGGERGLAEAAAGTGLDLAEILDLLDAAPESEPAVEWGGLDLADLVTHIEESHHAYLRDALPRLRSLAEKVHDVLGERHPELAAVRDLVGALAADMEPHLLKEERILFPMVRELAEATTAPTFHCGSLGNPIHVMSVEHDRVGELLRHLRTRTGGYTTPGDGCASFRALYEGLAELEADTHLHVHKENNVLFPAVMAAEQALAGSDR